MTPDLADAFPSFAALLPKAEPEQFLPPRTREQLAELERSLGVALPSSYRTFLEACGGLWLFGGAVQIGPGHPFLHTFPPFEELSPEQRASIRQRGGPWPPPSQGMLCFAEYFLEADGDQVLFDLASGSKNGEYPVYYYAHSDSPARVTRMAGSFADWIEIVCIQRLLNDDI